jgi:ribose/xylose/arabinose/galactoside ABC-type transport system permease subunit
MTYADSGQGFGDEPRFRDEPGFREEPDFRPGSGMTTPYQTGGYPVDDYSSRLRDTSAGMSRRPVSAAELDDVFDGPERGDPGMDRMAVHLVWELLLLLGCVGMYILFRQTHRAGVSGDALYDLLLTAASLGFITIGMALSLRAAAVNLAVGPIAAASALFFAGHSDRSLPATIGVTILLAAAVGLVIAVLVAGFHVPAWAATLAGAFGVIVWIQKHTAAAENVATYQPARQAYYWYGAFAALSLLGGVLGLVRPIRRAVGRFRPVGDPASRRGGGGAMAFLALVISSALAGLGGALLGLSSHSIAPTDGLVTTGFALGVALVGGTSAYGRRGGIFGTVLAVTLFVLLVRYGDAANWRVAQLAWAAGTIAAGLVVTRLVETLGRPRQLGLDEEAEDEGGWATGTRGVNGQATGWSNAPRQGGWSSQLPARSLDDTWAGDDRWGTK